VVAPRAPLDPVFVGEFIVRLEDDGGSGGRHFRLQRVGVGFEKGGATMVVHLVLVERARAYVGDEEFPDAGDAEASHLMEPPVPVVETADDAHAVRVRRPHGERDAFHAAEATDVRAQFFVELQVTAFGEEVFVEIAERGEEGVRIALREDVAVRVGDAQTIGEGFCFIRD
jgi:hypothetical protein